MIERRVYERVPFFCDIAMTILPAAQVVEAHSYDISLGGVGLVTVASVRAGAMVGLAFSLRDKTGKSVVNQVNGRVVRCDADLDGNRLGIEFLTPLNAATSPQLMKRVVKI